MIIICGLVLILVTTISSGEMACQTANNEHGECLIIKDCPSLYSMVKLSVENETIKNYLRGSVCAYEKKTPIVCCPGINGVSTESNFDTLLDPPKCGVSQHKSLFKIVGGKPSQLGDWPWEVAIGYTLKKRPSSIDYHCGGALISDQFVLTAAHCNNDENINIVSVRMGVINLKSTSKSKVPPVDVKVVKIIQHESYDRENKQNDIALIQLADKIKFSKYVQPICLPKTSYFRENNFVNETVYVAGWGTVGFRKRPSPIQLEISLPVLPNNICEVIFLKFGIRITNTNLCAGYLNGEKDACQGDSGGPLMLKRNGITYVLGVVSFGYKCAEEGYPGVYTKVVSHLKWITEKIKS